MPLTPEQKQLFDAINQGKKPIFEGLITPHRLTGKAAITAPSKLFNEAGLTPFHVAAALGNSYFLEELIKKFPKEDINCLSAPSEDKNYPRFSPLHCAVMKTACIANIQALLEAGADINFEDTMQYTPLDDAIRNKKVESVLYLLAHNANPNTRHFNGRTTLDSAITVENPIVVEALLAYGFDLSKMYSTVQQGTLLEGIGNKTIKNIIEEYMPIKFKKEGEVGNLESKNKKELIMLRDSLIGNEPMLLSREKVLLIEHIHSWLILRSYPAELPATPFQRKNLNGKCLDKFKLTDSLYFLVPSSQNELVTLFQLPTYLTRATIINYLLTALLNKKNRHSWESPPCQVRRKLIGYLNPNYATYAEEELVELLRARENASGDYFSGELSDDSDDEVIKLLPPRISAEFDTVRIRVGGQRYTQQLEKTVNDLKNNKFNISAENAKDRKDNILSSQNFQDRAKLPHPIKDLKKIEDDLNLLNRALKRGKSIQEAQAAVSTSFVVAQYRGVSHDLRWNRRSRQQHRQSKEAQKPVYSASVYLASDFNIFRQYSAEKAARLESTLKIIGKTLRSQLLLMRQEKNYPKGNYRFDSLADYAQDSYSKDYKKFHESLQEGGALSHGSLGEYFINEQNPMISTGDRPYHSLRYAFGAKPYGNMEDKRLRPRWNKEMRAEHPYAGKVYISLHPITDYTDATGPLHLPTLVRQGRSNLYNLILHEREATFPGMIDSQRVVQEMIARYPSFDKSYKSVYLKKYGLDKEAYELFQSGIQLSRPHSNERRYIQKVLSNWLCAFHEVVLIKGVCELATQRGGVVVYQDTEGGFSLELPPIAPTKGPVYEEITRFRQQRQM